MDEELRWHSLRPLCWERWDQGHHCTVRGELDDCGDYAYDWCVYGREKQSGRSYILGTGTAASLDVAQRSTEQEVANWYHGIRERADPALAAIAGRH